MSVSGVRPGKVPLFFVDVETAPGQSERLAVYKDDNLGRVAEEFLRRHNQPLTKTVKLQQMLEHHMRVHKSRNGGR